MTAKEIHRIGEAPPFGEALPKMYASLIRESRFGARRAAFRIEAITTPAPGPRQALAYVMAAGTNHNNVRAALGRPASVIAERQRQGAGEGFRIGGSGASGVACAVGEEVANVEVGDHVVLSCGMRDEGAPDIEAGGDPMMSPTNRTEATRRTGARSPVHARRPLPALPEAGASDLGGRGGLHARRRAADARRRAGTRSSARPRAPWTASCG